MSAGEGHSVYGRYDDVIPLDNSTFGNSTLSSMPDPGEVIHVPPGSSQLQAFRYVCEVGLAFPLALLGVVGNILAMVVLCRQKQRLTTTAILLALAVTDTLILLSTISVRSTRYLDPFVHYHEAYHHLFRWLYPGIYFFRLTGTWLTVLLTVERFIAVCLPLKANRLCSLTRTYMLMGLVIVCSGLFSLPRVFEWQLVPAVHPDTNVTRYFSRQTSLTESAVYNIGYRIFLFFLIMYLIPMTTLIVLNTKLVVALREASVQRATLQPPSLLSTSSRNNRSVTVIVVTVVLVCILCNVFAMVGHILWSIPMVYKHLGPTLDIYRRYISNISNVLVTLNSAINFIIYCLCSRNFRSILLDTFHCEKVAETPQPESVSLTKRHSGGSSENTQSTSIRNSVRSEMRDPRITNWYRDYTAKRGDSPNTNLNGDVAK